jgi:hypothetical protein
MKALLRINRPTAGAAPAAAGPGGALPPNGDPWLTRLVKLVPSEVLAVYLAGKELAKSWLGIWAFICLILVIVARAFTTKGDAKPVQWASVAVSSASFVIWVYAVGDHFFAWTLPPDTGIASIAVLVWTFLVPYFYKGD